MKIKVLAFIFIVLLGLFSVPISARAAEFVQYTDADLTVTPDKYNTGVYGDQFTSVTVDDAADLKKKYFNLPFKKASDTLLVINFHANKTMTGEVLIENVDFSGQSFAIYNSDLCQKQLRIVFSNCKFSSFGMRDENELVTFEFRNCSFTAISGSNMALFNCYIGGNQNDGIRAFNNVDIVNCYIADKSQPYGTTNVGNHVDGTQIYGIKDGTCKNIHFSNCRFEIPCLFGSTAPVNACLMLQIEFCDADDITFRNCTINGGGYSIYAWSKNNVYELTNAIFENIKVGCANKFGTIYPRKGKNIAFTNITDTHELYIGSVWKSGTNAHISVSNDTNTVRTLLVCTDTGEKTYTIDACPLHSEMVQGITFNDLPFDIDIEVGKCDWMVCYDITDGTPKQIRYANFIGKAVEVQNGRLVTSETVDFDSYYDGNVAPARNTFDNVVKGVCGGNVLWTLRSDGTLVIEGEGSIEDYHSGNKAPWVQYKDIVTSVVICEGITKIGNQAFKDMSLITSVELPSSLRTIGSIAFQRCISLRNITIPANVTSIGERCFAGDNLVSVSFLGTDITKVSVGAYNSNLLSAAGK